MLNFHHPTVTTCNNSSSLRRSMLAEDYSYCPLGLLTNVTVIKPEYMKHQTEIKGLCLICCSAWPPQRLPLHTHWQSQPTGADPEAAAARPQKGNRSLRKPCVIAATARLWQLRVDDWNGPRRKNQLDLISCFLFFIIVSQPNIFPHIHLVLGEEVRFYQNGRKAS